MKKNILNKLILALALITCNIANAGLIVIDATERGSYNNSGVFGSGESGTAIGNYIVGHGVDDRNFFNFDLSGLSGKNILSVDFLISNTDGSNVGFIQYALFDFSLNINSLANGTGGMAAHDDLGTGQIFGQKLLDSGDVGNVIETISFNANGVSALSASLGGDFAFGGRLLNQEYFLFGWSAGAEFKTQLSISYEDSTRVPEPSTLAIFALSLLAIARRKHLKA